MSDSAVSSRTVYEEILRQRKRILAQNRCPSRVQIGVDLKDAVYQEEHFVGPSWDDAADGRIFGLAVEFVTEPAKRSTIRVLPDDWQGDAQGVSRGR